MTMQEDFGKITQETMEQLENGGAFLMTGEPVNPMTIGWLELGRSWNKPVATIFVRRSRFSCSILAMRRLVSVTRSS